MNDQHAVTHDVAYPGKYRLACSLYFNLDGVKIVDSGPVNDLSELSNVDMEI